MKYLMITGRTVNQGVTVENKTSVEYAEETSTCFMHGFDMLELGLDDGDAIRVTGPCGAVVMRAVASVEVEIGTVFVPYGPYANHIIDADTHSTGMPDFKSHVVEIEPTDEEPKTVHELMEELGGLAYDDR
ncbi:MAG TPA: molybdopterin dinucleotide binding domain-containing protein [Candidatus Methanoculleus thermohydrogenotrophicum]|jgi:formylmethanofuran dehydrogenase subunit D|nr:molybdopterin dinucleotide binding domain-containing protein [Candidatus Methanoculleus thermohydrogenotrophicum]NLM82779.1 molybdopterin dinucleotide-binding protein [Candidatus Methanoculleus thermohydrogenotrophicum]HOB18040.1 molybdopterin dinucleotide binding domain-containing protein [Candidatus Methanoculleus thermohydrogenotrophicum]HPZ38134.1 molybdopterin dinucleotide binding domain-containing protein [Candidatus Methanoculleus thermohydrogenotrophicum]HQC91006.1 molybdopterin dinu